MIFLIWFRLLQTSMTVSIIHVLMVEHVKMVLTLTCVNVWRDSAETIVKIVSCYFICIRFIFLLIFVVTYLLCYWDYYSISSNKRPNKSLKPLFRHNVIKDGIFGVKVSTNKSEIKYFAGTRTTGPRNGPFLRVHCGYRDVSI